MLLGSIRGKPLLDCCLWHRAEPPHHLGRDCRRRRCPRKTGRYGVSRHRCRQGRHRSRYRSRQGRHRYRHNRHHFRQERHRGRHIRHRCRQGRHRSQQSRRRCGRQGRHRGRHSRRWCVKGVTRPGTADAITVVAAVPPGTAPAPDAKVINSPED